MIRIDLIKKYFPTPLQNNSIFYKYMIKEYLQLLVLDYLSTSPYVRKLSFIGGTNLRLVMGIDRFSEDIDFDCTDLSHDEFINMTDSVQQFLYHNGFRVELKEHESDKIQAFRRSIYFPELMFNLGLSGHREERFLIKLEAQDQQVNYRPTFAYVKGCGYFFPFPLPSVGVLCAMKIAAMLSRKKGRDFYDVLFLLSQTEPDYTFLTKKCGIRNLNELKKNIAEMLIQIDLKNKMKDFEHLLLNKSNSRKILHIGEFIRVL